VIVHGAMHEAALACGTLTRGGNRRSAYTSEVIMSRPMTGQPPPKLAGSSSFLVRAIWQFSTAQISSFVGRVLSAFSYSHFRQKRSISIQQLVCVASSEGSGLHLSNHATKSDNDPTSFTPVGSEAGSRVSFPCAPTCLLMEVPSSRSSGVPVDYLRLGFFRLSHAPSPAAKILEQ